MFKLAAIHSHTLHVRIFNSILFWNPNVPTHMMNLNHALWVMKERKLILEKEIRKIEKKDILTFINSHAQ